MHTHNLHTQSDRVSRPYRSHIDRLAKNFRCNFQLPDQKLQHARQQSITASKSLLSRHVKALPAIPSSHVWSIGSPLFLPKEVNLPVQGVSSLSSPSHSKTHLKTNNPCKKHLWPRHWPPPSKGARLIVRVSSLHQHRQGLVSDRYPFGGKKKPWLAMTAGNPAKLHQSAPCSSMFHARPCSTSMDVFGSFWGLAKQRFNCCTRMMMNGVYNLTSCRDEANRLLSFIYPCTFFNHKLS